MEIDKTEDIAKKIIKGGSISFSGNIFGKSIRLILEIILTRVLGASVYGLYAIGINLMEITTGFSTFGFHNSIVRFGSVFKSNGDNENLKGTFLISVLFPFIISIIISILMYFFSDIIAINIFKKPELIIVIRMLSFALPFYAFLFLSANAARVFLRMDYAANLEFVIHPLLTLIIVVFLFLIGFKLEGILLAFSISSVVSAFLGFYILIKLYPDLISKLRPRFPFKKIFTYSSTVFVSGFSSTLLLSKADRIMLGIMDISRNVGIYNAGVTTAHQMSIFLISFNAIFSPIIAAFFNKGKIKQLGELFKTVTRWIFTFSFPIFLIFVLFSKDIMGLFGSEFKAGGNVLIILGAGTLIDVSVGSVGFMLNMTGKERVEFMNILIFGTINIALNLILIPRLSYLGAAVATAISIGLLNISRLLEVHHFYKVHPYNKSFLKPLFSGLITYVAIYILKTSIHVKGLWWLGITLLFLLIYSVILIGMGIEKNDLMILEALKNKIGLKRNSNKFDK